MSNCGACDSQQYCLTHRPDPYCHVTPDNAMSGSMSPTPEPTDEVVATNEELTNMVARLAKVVEGQAEQIKNIEEHLNG